MKRFYKDASAGVLDDGSGFGVLLDGRPVRTPAKAVLAVPTQAFAEAVAAEWNAQSDDVDPETMPLMRVACTAMDHVAITRAEREAEAARFGETDLVCYRVTDPAALVERQRAAWDPLIDWASSRFGAALVSTSDALAVRQPTGALEALAAAVSGRDIWTLTALLAAVRASGSLVVGLAMMEGRLDAEGAFEAAEIEETWQIERWGEDSEATARREGLKRELATAERVFALVRP